jgi:L-asparagine transporter-like permease
MVAALLLERRYSGTAYVYMLGSAFFGGIFVWLMIFVTHLMFRRRAVQSGQIIKRFGPRGPWASIFGAAALGAVLISTWWVPGLRITLTAGLPWLLFITLCYLVWRKRHPRDAGATVNG